jgi:hypothetical protein
MHDPSDGVLLPFDQQMKVVGHQAVWIEEKTGNRAFCRASSERNFS